jgi:hypothetical protein
LTEGAAEATEEKARTAAAMAALKSMLTMKKKPSVDNEERPTDQIRNRWQIRLVVLERYERQRSSCLMDDIGIKGYTRRHHLAFIHDAVGISASPTRPLGLNFEPAAMLQTTGISEQKPFGITITGVSAWN